MSDDRNEQIRERAYRIWQDEGEPHGREHDHWAQAAREIGEDISVTGEPEDADAGESGPAASDATDAATVPAIGTSAADAPPPTQATKAGTPGKSL